MHASSFNLPFAGWAAIFKHMEEHDEEGPQTCVDGTSVRIPVKLIEFVAVHSTLTRASIESLAREEGWKPMKESLSSYIKEMPTTRPSPELEASRAHPSRLFLEVRARVRGKI